MATDLRRRGIRTLAWLGDAHFEREVRWRVAARGDYPTDRLDAIKAEVVRAQGQAELLAAIEPDLDDDERAVVRRARNASLPASARGRRGVATYRASTAFEALVALWALSGDGGRARFDAVLADRLEEAIAAAVQRRRFKPRRG
jgi:ribonuclease-3 family protein